MIFIGDIILWGVLLFVIILTITAAAFLYLRVPFVPSDNKSLQTLLSSHPLKGTEQVCDLGSGNGKVLFFLHRHYPSLQLTGYEIALLPYLMGILRNWYLHFPIRFYFKNFLYEDLSSHDVFFCYLTPRALQNVVQKIKQYHKPVTLITNAFQIREHLPERTIPIPHSNAHLYIYRL